LLSIEGTVPNLDISTMTFDSSTELGNVDSVALDQSGEVTSALIVDGVTIQGEVILTASPNRVILFKFAGVSSNVQFNNFEMKSQTTTDLLTIA
jgi:hypothetical protein